MLPYFIYQEHNVLAYKNTLFVYRQVILTY